MCQFISQSHLFPISHLQDHLALPFDIRCGRVSHEHLFSSLNRFKGGEHLLVKTHMASSTSVNPPFLRVRPHQVHLRDNYCEVDVRHIFGDTINYIGFLGFVTLLQSTIRRLVTLIPTVESFPLELMLLGDPSFRSEHRAPPFVVLLFLGTLTMFHKVCLHFW